MAKMRTINQAIADVKKSDPDTAISTNYIRTLVKNGVLPVHKAGSKVLINMDLLENFLAEPGSFDNRNK